MKKKDLKKLSDRIETLMRITHPYEIASVCANPRADTIDVTIEFVPMCKPAHDNADMSVCIALENILTRYGRCLDHKRQGRIHTFQYQIA